MTSGKRLTQGWPRGKLRSCTPPPPPLVSLSNSMVPVHPKLCFMLGPAHAVGVRACNCLGSCKSAERASRGRGVVQLFNAISKAQERRRASAQPHQRSKVKPEQPRAGSLTPARCPLLPGFMLATMRDVLQCAAPPTCLLD